MANSKTSGVSYKKLVEVIVFDFGGVIQELLDDVMCKILASKMNVPIDIFNTYYQNKISLVQTGEIDEEAFIKYLAKNMSTNPPDNYKDLLIAPFADDSRLYMPIVNIMERLNIMKFPIAVLSNTIPSHADLNRKRGNYRWFGDNVFLSFEIGYVKPSPESFKYVASKVKNDLSRLLLIDDDEENLKEARSLGMNTIHHDSKIMTASNLIMKLQSYSIQLQNTSQFAECQQRL
jgi:FMN phosphatase YigB (HAD superfamily)